MVAPAATWEVEALELVRYRGEVHRAGDRFAMKRRDAQSAIARRHVRAVGAHWLQALPAPAPLDVFPVQAEEQWVLAGGPSLAEVLELIPDDAVTWGVNRVQPGPALEGVPITYWVTCDAEMADRGPEAGAVVRRFLRADHGGPDDVQRYQRLLAPGVSFDWRAGVGTVGGSAYTALQLAVQAGARHVHIAGVDLSGGYFDGAPNPAGKYAAQAPAWQQALECLQACGITWTNWGSPALEYSLAGAA